MEENKKKKIIMIVLIAIIVVAAIGAAVYLKSRLTVTNDGPIDGSIGTEELIGDVSKEVIDSEGQGINLSEEALSLSLQYPDCIGWLMVPGTSIDTAIFQAKDNDKYLRFDRDRVNTGWGEPFLDYVCDYTKINEKQQHYIIYCHNTGEKEDICFNTLLNYKNEEFMKNHKYIEFSTLDGNYKWEIFSIFITDTDDFYIDVEFADENEYYNFLKQRKSMSMFNTNTEISKDDNILTLSTCDYTRSNGRFVVMAKLVR